MKKNLLTLACVITGLTVLSAQGQFISDVLSIPGKTVEAAGKAVEKTGEALATPFEPRETNMMYDNDMMYDDMGATRSQMPNKQMMNYTTMPEDDNEMMMQAVNSQVMMDDEDDE